VALGWRDSVARAAARRRPCGEIAPAPLHSIEGKRAVTGRKTTNILITRSRKTRARCDFEDIPPGTYALAVIHDENMNGKLDTQWLGIPTEGYGFSNDVRARFGAPSFTAASVPYDGETLDLTISLHY